MTQSLFYTKQAQEEKGDGAACCLPGWKKRPSHPTLFAKFLPKKMYRMSCWYKKAFLLRTRPMDPDSVGKVIRIRIANMYPITKKIIKCSNLKDQNFLSGGLEAFPSRSSKKNF